MLAALDVHTAKWIVDKCFRGDLLQGRTVLLVTHNVNMVAPIANFVVSLGSDGQILSQGTISEALAKNSKLRQEVAKEKALDDKIEQVGTDVEQLADEEDRVQELMDGEEQGGAKKDGRLVVEEELAEGHISWDSGEC